MHNDSQKYIKLKIAPFLAPICYRSGLINTAGSKRQLLHEGLGGTHDGGNFFQ